MIDLEYGSLWRLTDQAGKHMTDAGRALTTIANLPGNDGWEFDLASQRIYGLATAVHVIGAAIRTSDFDLCGKVEEVTQP